MASLLNSEFKLIADSDGAMIFSALADVDKEPGMLRVRSNIADTIGCGNDERL
jgi:hypothetical protein